MEGKTNGMSITVKKVLSILILSVLTGCMVGNAIADDFSVRNGIQFGISIDEVKQIETSNGIIDTDIYLDEVNGDIRYIAEDEVFKVRLIL